MDTYTSKQARNMLHVDVKTFLRWLDKAGIHPQVSKADNRVKLFTLEQLEHLAAEHERVLDMRIVEEVPPQTSFADLVDLVMGMTGHILDLQMKVDALERHIHAQDEKIVQLESQPDRFPIPHKQPISRPLQRQLAGDLPEGTIPVYLFAENHAVNSRTLRDQITKGIRGEHIEAIEREKAHRPGEHERYFTPAQQRACILFWQRHGTRFVRCEQCPH